MLIARWFSCGIALSTLCLSGLARGEEVPQEDLAPCAGSRPQPEQSALWDVAFCNRTGHDLVIQFHDNDCPAQQWAHRGDVYERTLRRGESKTFSLCFAKETGRPVPGMPMVRIPGGKGVVTTWNIVGDCGERSSHLYTDARTFYDRGDYSSGIILLQHPAGASHCTADSSAGSTADTAGSRAGSDREPATAAPGASSPSSARAAAREAPQAAPADRSSAAATPESTPTTTAQMTVAPATAPSPTEPPQRSETSPVSTPAPPILRAAVDPNDVIQRTVVVNATSAAGQPTYACSVALKMTFGDASSWTGKVTFDVPPGSDDARVATKKYFKSVSSVELTSTKCSPR